MRLSEIRHGLTSSTTLSCRFASKTLQTKFRCFRRPLARSAMSRSSAVVMGAGSLAGVASDVSALMDVQAVVSARHALQPHSDEHAPAKLREAHAALDAVHREDGQRLPRRRRLTHLPVLVN